MFVFYLMSFLIFFFNNRISLLLQQHANGENAWIGIDGNTGAITDMKEQKVK